MILVDTNVFVRLSRRDDPDRPCARRAIAAVAPWDQRTVVPQILFEFWVVATRPIDQNGLGMHPDRATAWLAYIKRSARLIVDPPELVTHWEHLLHLHKTMGKAAHDARLIAAMQLHGIDSILTFNAAYLARYPVKVVDPRTV